MDAPGAAGRASGGDKHVHLHVGPDSRSFRVSGKAGRRSQHHQEQAGMSSFLQAVVLPQQVCSPAGVPNVLTAKRTRLIQKIDHFRQCNSP